MSIKFPPPNLDERYAKYPVFEDNLIDPCLWKASFRRQVILNRNILSKIFLKYLNSWEDLAFKSLHGIDLKKSMHILDVGCGKGILIDTLRKFGFKNLTGIDPFLKKSLEIPGIRKLKMNLGDLKEDFDLIMCHHSFEHFQDPHLAIKSLEILTKPGGLLLIRMPNIESYSFRYFKESWHGIHAPFHSFLPSLKGMKNLFQGTSFEFQETRQEQIVELFLYNINYSLDVGLLEPLGVLACIGNGSLGSKIPPLFTKNEIDFWREKTKVVMKYKVADYIGYYLRKKA